MPGQEQRAGVSASSVDRAGSYLRQWWLAPSESALDESRLRAAAGILFGFREGFQPSLKKVTVGVRQFVQRETAGGIVVGQRLKRAPQMVSKLTRHPTMRLSTMQDIGGCRAILAGGQPEVDAVARRIRRRWNIHHEKDYGAEPAPSGYRGRHLIVARDEHLIEIQLRTSRQHDWAEAVERTALRTGYELKDGKGPAALLRYFRMAGQGMALEEAGDSPDSRFRQEFTELQLEVRDFFRR
jgi:putative GTP pyrophosphokinase